MRNTMIAIRESLRSGFWAVPALCVVVAVALALGLVRVDRAVDRSGGRSLTFGAGPDGAREVLSAITSSMITFTGLVFSITIVVLQLTSSQFSPRVLRTFLRDRQTQLALGVFVATFVYAVLVLRSVDARDESVFVPAISTTVGVLLLLVSVGFFVSYIHHVATAIQVSSIITAISAETREAIERRYPAGQPEPAQASPPPTAPPSAVLPAPRSGVVTSVDEQALVEVACSADVVLVLHARPGDFVPEGARLVSVVGDAGRLDLTRVRRSVTQARNRTMDQDVAFGFRQLVDIAERALSPGVNDPTTAVEALDAVHDLLRRLVTRPLRDGLHRDVGDGTVRLVVPPELLADHLALALDEVEHYGKDSLQVRARVDRMLVDLIEAARPEHVAALAARARSDP